MNVATSPRTIAKAASIADRDGLASSDIFLFLTTLHQAT